MAQRCRVRMSLPGRLRRVWLAIAWALWVLAGPAWAQGTAAPPATDEAALRAAIRTAEARADADPTALAASLKAYAGFLARAQRRPEAIAVWQQVLQVEERAAPDSLGFARSLVQLGLLLTIDKRAADAVPLYQRSLPLYERHMGPEHAQVETLVLLIAQTQRGLDAERAALPWYERGLALRARRLGPAHVEVAKLQNDVAMLHLKNGQYEQALPFLLAGLPVLEQALGDQHPDVASMRNSLAEAYRVRGDYALALPLYQRSLSVREQHLGADHPQVAQSLHNLANLHQTMGAFTLALPLYQRSLAIRERVLGPGDPAVAASLDNLAVLYRHLGEYALALPLSLRALAIREQRLGVAHQDVARNLFNLAALYQVMGRADESLAAYGRCLAMFERLWGPDHPEVATVLHNLAALYRARGDYAQALPAHRRSLAIREARLGPVHEEVAASLHNLAYFYASLGDRAQAGPLYARSLAIYVQVFGAQSVPVAMVLSNQAELLAAQGAVGDALALHERALAIREQRLGPLHMDVAYSLTNVANMRSRQQQTDLALPLYRRSLEILEARLGPSHPDVALALANMALVQLATGTPAPAMETLTRAVVIAGASPTGRETLARAQRMLSRVYAAQAQPALAIVWGKEAVNTLQGLRTGLDALDKNLQGSYLDKNRRTYDELAELLLQQGRITEAQEVLQMLKEQELHESLQRAQPADARSTRIALTGLERSRFGGYYALRDSQAALGAEREQLERQERLGALAPAQAARLREITEALMPVAAQAMRAFLRALEQQMANAAVPPAVPVAQEATRLRVAIDSLAQSEPAARAVGLQYLVGEERLSIILTLPGTPPIAYQQAVGRRQLQDRISAVRLALQRPAGTTANDQSLLQDLHGLLLGPVQADLQRFGARTLMLSLDDQLRLIPFAALMAADGRYLVQDYTLALYNEAARQALERPSGAAWRVAAMGVSEEVEGLPALPAVPAEINGIVSRRGIAGDAYLNAQFGRQRLVSALDVQAGYNVLHVASHFVFQPGVPGASRLYLGDKSQLSLADIAREDLRFGNFELVTFSACDTAVGGGRDSDGQEMESLSAKTQNQGARAVMATLWKVSDHSTGGFMQHFYGLRGEAGLNKAEALRAVQTAMIEGRLQRDEALPPGDDAGVQARGVRTPLAAPHGSPQGWRAPYHWAPFVLMGNWR